MTRIRITFLLLALALLLPVALLVRGALQSVGKERELRHQAIAERIFDEMERELTTFLRREEERGVEQYARLASGSVDEVPEPFIKGYFQVLPDGSVDAWPESVAVGGGGFREELEPREESGTNSGARTSARRDTTAGADTAPRYDRSAQAEGSETQRGVTGGSQRKRERRLLQLGVGVASAQPRGLRKKNTGTADGPSRYRP